MNNSKRLVIFLTVIVLSVTFPAAVYASDVAVPQFDDEVVFFGTFSLESGERLNGSLIVFGGVVSLEEDSRITGDLVIFGGNVTAGGAVDGSVLAVGGVVSLEDTALIRGDLIAPATVVRKDDGAQINGQIITETDNIDIPELPDIQPPPTVDSPSFWDNVSVALRPVVNFFTNIVRALLFAAVALVVLLLVPRHGQRVSNMIEQNPVLAGGFGLLSVFIFVFAVVILALLSVTIILIPVTIPAIILLSLGLALGMFFGIIVVGAELGRRIMLLAKQTWNTNVQVAIGTFSLVFLLGLFNIALWDFIASLLWTIVGAIGLGAVLLTRFGTREYVPAGRTAPPAPPVSPAAVEDQEPADPVAPETPEIEAGEPPAAPEESAPETDSDPDESQE